MVSDHDKLLETMVKEYLDKGYKPAEIRLIGYRPDEIMENEEEIVLLESVDKNDHGGLILPEEINGKPVRWDKRYCHPKYVFVPFDSINTLQINTIRILIQEYVGYKNRQPHYGKARQITIATTLTLEELRDFIAKDYKIPVREVGRPRSG